MNVTIMTDSASDLSPAEAKQLGVELIPLNVISGDTSYRDRVDLAPESLFRDMREGAVFKTSQPAVGVFEQAFRKHAEAGRPCLYIAFSSELSGTHQSAVLAREQVLEDFPDCQLEIIDSLCASTGLGLIVQHAAEMANRGEALPNIAEAVRWRASHMEHIFTVDNLEYLLRGGRISAFSAFIGSLLQIKPILHVDEGKLIPIEKIRGRRKVLPRMVDMMAERAGGANLDKQVIGICHGDDLEAANALKDMIAERFGCTQFYIAMIGATIGAHAGPGTLSVFFLNETPPEVG